MKSLLAIVCASLLVGLAVGAAIAYVEVPTATHNEQPEQIESTIVKQAVPSFPKAELPETIYKFGNIEHGASMSHEFVIRNTGNAPLRVEVASTTCKCTVGDLTDNEIAPNQESKILLEWVAKTGPGPYRHGAILSTNDPTQSRIELVVEGQVVESTSMSPSMFVLGAVRPGESAKAHLYLMAFLDQEVEVLDYKFSSQALADKFDLKITPAEKSELPSPDAVSGLKVEATFQADKTIGPFTGWVTLSTNQEKYEKLTVYITGSVKGDVTVFGPGWNAKNGTLRMGSFASAKGKSVRLNLAVSNPDAGAASWEIAKIDPPELQVTLQEPRKISDNLQHVPMMVEVPAGTRPMIRLGEPISNDALILLRSNHPKIPDLQMKVRFVVE